MRAQRLVLCTLLAAGLTAALRVFAWAGTTGVLTGFVSNTSTGKALAGAHVEVFVVPGECTGSGDCELVDYTGTWPREIEVAIATSDGSGFFAFASLPPGTYRVRGFSKGLRSFPHCPSTVVVRADESTSANLYLSPPYRVIGAMPRCLPTQPASKPQNVYGSYSFDGSGNLEQ